MTRYIGMDVHKRQVEICIMDQKGKVLKRIRCACTREVLQKLAQRQFTKRDHVALETTTNAWAVADLIRPHVVVGRREQSRQDSDHRCREDQDGQSGRRDLGPVVAVQLSPQSLGAPSHNCPT